MANSETDTRPLVNILEQGGTRLAALYDTGAAVTVKLEEAFLSIPRRDQPQSLEGEPMRVTGVDKKTLCIQGCYGVTFKIQGRVIKHDTLVVSGFCADAVIGCDVIN